MHGCVCTNFKTMVKLIVFSQFALKKIATDINIKRKKLYVLTCGDLSLIADVLSLFLKFDFCLINCTIKAKVTTSNGDTKNNCTTILFFED